MPRDGHIRLLPVQVANKIAAGEVVERPASVVKELLENAIDAGATRIDITITAGGRKLIEVRDNGCGMARDDALLCLERQATSKIRDVDDIERITTLGFRGEAVPSIASVSRFILKTRRAESDAGTEITVVGGSIQDVRDAGVPPGTSIEVRDLFFNVPARRKFLRAYQTEQAHIRTVFTLHALAHPDIGMSLTSDGREQTRLPPGATLEERVRDLFGADFSADLRPVDARMGHIRVYGFVSLPGQTRNDRSEQYIFINGRPATAPVIAYALREAYPPLAQDRKPIVLLFLEIPPDSVDVNVHPTKREVRFHKPAEIREAIIRAIREALGMSNAQHGMSNIQHGISNDQGECATGEPLAETQGMPNGQQGMSNIQQGMPNGQVKCATGERPREPLGIPVHTLPFGMAGRHALPGPARPPRVALPLRTPNSELRTSPPPAPAAPDGSGLPLFVAPDSASPWKWCRVVAMLEGGYALLETDGGYVTVDPRAARERVLFESLMAHQGKAEAYSQRLLLPETVKLAPADAARLRKHLPLLLEMGFGVDAFGGDDHFVVEALPDVLGEVSCRELLGNIAHDLEHAGVRRGTEKWREEIVAKAACRVATGQGRVLALPEVEALVNALAATRMPYVCPRGKPTMIFTSYRELDRKFGK